MELRGEENEIVQYLVIIHDFQLFLKAAAQEVARTLDKGAALCRYF